MEKREKQIEKDGKKKQSNASEITNKTKPVEKEKSKEIKKTEKNIDLHKEAKVDKQVSKQVDKPIEKKAEKKEIENKNIDKNSAKSESKSKNKSLSHAVGRRKAAIARIWLKRGNGKLIINTKDYKNYFDTEPTRISAFMPFAVYPQASTLYNVEANVIGGGLCAQADAVKLGISRALTLINDQLKPLFKEHGLLTVDSRVKERKKYGQKAARRKFQFVKR